MTGALYKLRSFGGVTSANACFIWDSHAPSRVKFFGWLLSMSRIHTRDVLLRKTIVEVAGAGCPLCDDLLEIASHMALRCPIATRFWAAVGVTVPPHAHVRDLHLLHMPHSVAAETAPTFAFLCYWQLWKQRNAAIFRETAPSLPPLLKLCRDDAALWSGCFPAEQRPLVDAWRVCLGGS
jgi:hypothetical protein